VDVYRPPVPHGSRSVTFIVTNTRSHAVVVEPPSFVLVTLVVHVPSLARNIHDERCLGWRLHCMYRPQAPLVKRWVKRGECPCLFSFTERGGPPVPPSTALGGTGGAPPTPSTLMRNQRRALRQPSRARGPPRRRGGAMYSPPLGGPGMDPPWGAPQTMTFGRFPTKTMVLGPPRRLPMEASKGEPSPPAHRTHFLTFRPFRMNGVHSNGFCTLNIYSHL
jgi:hypothetical protein